MCKYNLYFCVWFMQFYKCIYVNINEKSVVKLGVVTVYRFTKKQLLYCNFEITNYVNYVVLYPFLIDSTFFTSECLFQLLRNIHIHFNILSLFWKERCMECHMIVLLRMMQLVYNNTVHRLINIEKVVSIHII